MKAFFKEFLSYPKPERNGIIVLLLIIGVLAGVKYMLPSWIRPEVKTDFSQFQQEIAAFESDTIIELNAATQQDLERLKGIGPSLAEAIITYRNSLGGFIRKEQLNEAKGIGDAKYSAVVNFITVDSTRVKQLNINKLSEEELAAHPYVGKGIAKAIVKRRDKKGAFKNYSELSEIKLLKKDKYVRLRPYVKLK